MQQSIFSITTRYEIDICHLVFYRIHFIMIEIRQTEIFSRWLRGLRDRQARARIQTQIDRLQLGLSGNVKPVGEGVSELRIDYGPGYRVYFLKRGQELLILLAGGDKRTQSADIKKALKLARDL
jgi:putative addiction module killer protein